MNQFKGIFTNDNQETKIWESPYVNALNNFSIPLELVKKYNIPNGAYLKVKIKKNKVVDIISIAGRNASLYHKKISKKEVIIHPQKKFNLEKSAYDSTKIIDMFTPIGFGQRALIIAPPKTGKTMLLEQISNSITQLHPRVKVITLLIDERPEEITSFRMNTKSIIFQSSMDKGTNSHVKITHLLMDFIKTEYAVGNNIVVLIDSLTRLARAFNNNTKNTGKILTGGLSYNAMQLPRKLFGMAKNNQFGGSVTIIGTILVNTGSALDEVIFNEFKGTGNCDIVLDRNLADNRVFPAINLKESGTRKEEIFYKTENMDDIYNNRRQYLTVPPHKAINYLKKNFKKNNNQKNNSEEEYNLD